MKTLSPSTQEALEKKYRSLSSAKLEELISGHQNNLADKYRDHRIELLNITLAKREVKREVEPEPPITSFDEYIAKAYLAKVSNSKDRGIEMTLGINDMSRLLKRKKCAYTGRVLINNIHFEDPSKRTLDRVDNSLGYTKENTVACSYSANQLKNALFEDPRSKMRMTRKEFAMFAKKVLG